jgi:hypothetical protein
VNAGGESGQGLIVLLFVSMVIPVPVDTPIPCLICTATAAAATTTFSGTVSRIDATGLQVFDFTTRRLMAFEVPPGFNAVESADGAIATSSLAQAKPGLFARVTYTSAHGRNTAIKVLLLTGAQCRVLLASEAQTGAPATRCPD